MPLSASLSDTTGVSRETAREAIRSLADFGLIHLLAKHGAFVHDTPIEEVRNLYDLNGAIFTMARAASVRRVAGGANRSFAKKL